MNNKGTPNQNYKKNTAVLSYILLILKCSRLGVHMAIITLTSDWGTKDHYTAAVKCAILSRDPAITIVDISHTIGNFNLTETAFVLRNAFHHFPEGTIHIIAVNTEASVKHVHAVALYKGHYFIGADNGIFSLIFDEKPEKMIEISIPQDSDYFTFSSRDVFVKVACMIASGASIESTGSPMNDYNRLVAFKPVYEENIIRGVVTYIDSFDNCITNITEAAFKEIGKGRRFTVYFRTDETDEIKKAYSDVPPGEIVTLFGTTGYLEVAINQGCASGLLGLQIADSVRIDFEE